MGISVTRKVPIVLISFQIRQNEEIDSCYEMKAVYIYIYIWWRNWISTNHVRDGNKYTELFSHWEKNRFW